MEAVWTPKRQGNLGEYSAIVWLGSVGAIVGKPLVEHSDYDLFADFGAGALRVQVKTSTCFINGRYSVTLATRGGNQSWNGLVKCLDPERCDFLFVHVGDGRRWFIPSGALGGRSGIVVGGPKYADYEIERGEPLQARPKPTE